MGIETMTMVQGLQAGGAALGAVSAYQASSATKQAYDTQAQIAGNNAQVAGWQAQDAITRGARSASASRMRSHQLAGTQRARMAAQGVDLGVGSALEILTDTAYFGEVDAGTITDNAAKEAWAIRQQAAGYRADASLLKTRSDSESPLLAGGTSLLTSAGRVAGGWYTGSSGGSRRSFDNVDYQQRGDY